MFDKKEEEWLKEYERREGELEAERAVARAKEEERNKEVRNRVEQERALMAKEMVQSMKFKY